MRANRQTISLGNIPALSPSTYVGYTGILLLLAILLASCVSLEHGPFAGGTHIPKSPPLVGASWTQVKADNSVSWSWRFGHQAVAFNGSLYVLGGWDGGFRNDVWISRPGGQ